MFPEGRALEFLIVAALALVFVGPKDLPIMLRKLGQFMAKVRGMAAEFRASFDEMARQSELDELRKEVEAMRAGQMADMASSASLDARNVMTEIHHDLSAPIAPATPYQFLDAQTGPEPAPKAVKPRTPRAKTAAAKNAKPAPPNAPAKPRRRKTADPGA